MKIVIGSAVPHDILLGVWKIFVLQLASEEGVVGNRLLQELRTQGYDISPGTLYPMLHRMEQNGLLRSHPQEGASKAPRTYKITAAGVQILQLIEPMVNKLNRNLSRSSRHRSHS